tara:strand:+ start:1045 stop:1158 length:114 start_codon:yes stop_codon:yes gene_type:complete
MEYNTSITVDIKEIEITYQIVNEDDSDRQGYNFQVNP